MSPTRDFGWKYPFVMPVLVGKTHFPRGKLPLQWLRERGQTSPCLVPENKNLSVGVYEKVVNFSAAGGEKNATLLSAQQSPWNVLWAWSGFSVCARTHKLVHRRAHICPGEGVGGVPGSRCIGTTASELGLTSYTCTLCLLCIRGWVMSQK